MGQDQVARATYPRRSSVSDASLDALLSEQRLQVLDARQTEGLDQALTTLLPIVLALARLAARRDSKNQTCRP